MRGQIVFYNTENFFDIYDDPATDDDSFTPEGNLEWTQKRYDVKVDHISRVLKEISQEYPLMIGLCEIETRKILVDLINHPNLKEGHYQFIHKDGPDERGIESAFMYRKEFVEVINYATYSVHFEFDPNDKTRDILYCETLLKGEKVHVFVNHWPSRREGVEKSTAKHVIVVQTLRKHINELLDNNPAAKILVMGDFNDTPADLAVKVGLNSGMSEGFEQDQLFYNLAESYVGTKEGTSAYRGDYFMFDQMLMNQPWFERKGWFPADLRVKIFRPNWITFKHPRYKDILPDRTYSGNSYKGGYSDHFPISLTIETEDA